MKLNNCSRHLSESSSKNQNRENKKQYQQTAKPAETRIKNEKNLCSQEFLTKSYSDKLFVKMTKSLFKNEKINGVAWRKLYLVTY